MLFIAGISYAQTQIGSDLHLNGSATITAGYNGSFGQQYPSEHELDIGGNGGIGGYYYAPQFVSFDVVPYYDQSRANSSFQSITGSSGVSTDASLFTGTRFPGAISFHKDYDSTGNYGLAGTPNFTTHDNGEGFGIGWSALLPNWPTLSAQYSLGTGNGTIYGTDEKSSSRTHTFNLHSTYNIAGFRLIGGYQEGSMYGVIPEFLSGQSNEINNTTYSNENISASRSLPLHGSLSLGFLHSATGFDNGTGTTGTSNYSSNTLNANAIFIPEPHFSMSFNGTYTDDLAGELTQQTITAGAAPVTSQLSSDSKSDSISGSAGYQISNASGFQTTVTHIDQHYLDTDYSSTYMSGTFYYNHLLFHAISFSLTGLDSANGNGQNGLGMQGNVNFQKSFGRWSIAASSGYTQNMQTMLVTYTTSSLSYGGSVRRRLNKVSNVYASFGGGHSGFSQQYGDTSHSETYSAGTNYHSNALTVNYSTSSGLSVLTATGLAQITTPVYSPSQEMLYDATSLGISASTSPIRKLSIGGAYSSSHSSTTGVTSSVNSVLSYTAQLQYEYRRLGITAGYNYFKQGISAAGVPVYGNSAFYIGVSRWIKVF